MATNYKDKTILIYDNGYGVEHAAALSHLFKKVYYFTPWQMASPKFQSYSFGLGMDKVEKVLNFFDYVDRADLIAFIDIGWGDVAHYLREKGHNVFGAGLGEGLETRRYDFRQLQKKIGLHTQKTVKVTGVTALREHLKKTPEQYVKFDRFRGDAESWFSKTYESSEMIIDEIESAFGPMKEEYDFICEESIGGEMETGIDTFYSAPVGWIAPTLWGLEWRKGCYIGKWDDPPPYHKKTMAALDPIMQKLNYRGPISTEEKVLDKKKTKSCIIDITARYPFSFSSGYPDWILNYDEVLWKVAAGEAVTIKPVAKFVGALPLESPHAEQNWVMLDFDKKLRNKGIKNGRVRLSMACCANDHYYAVKGNPVMYVLVAWGNTPGDVADVLEKLSHEVDAYGLTKSSANDLQKITELQKELGW